MLLFGAGFAEDDQDGEVDESLAEEAEVCLLYTSPSPRD